MRKKFLEFASEDGATAVEYGLITALIAIIVIIAFGFLSNPVNGLFSSIVDAFESVGKK
ncbi:Flp family type IVb pilin [Pelagibacterium lacus]|uniref:Flp family type IVb pilin n=1 Tax=Pelagibacterium lacus TaxID=2282655 RepID=A0A369W6C9_9HYPH|nr:Flp family type IVb pilin [Pelagibacterium lacus]RDE10098.1 Flp family type IVb pilin [Pelagibacterium lacus]